MENFNYLPLHDRVVIKPDPVEEKTEGGIIIPDSAKEKPVWGTIMASGPGLKDLPNTVQPGDRALFGKYAGTPVTLDKEEYLIMREADLLLIDDNK